MVVVDDSMFDRVAILIDGDLDVGCGSVRSGRVADDSEIDGSDTADQSIGDIVCLTAGRTEDLKDLDGTGPEGHDVAEHPPLIDACFGGTRSTARNATAFP